jgi:hypothetical protein
MARRPSTSCTNTSPLGPIAAVCTYVTGKRNAKRIRRPKNSKKITETGNMREKEILERKENRKRKGNR